MGKTQRLKTGWKKLVHPSLRLANCFGRHLTVDEIELVIQDVRIRLVRRTTLDVPHEVSVFIPRAELRLRQYQNGQLVSEEEKILNSITVVHAPRHPLAGEQPPAKAPQPWEITGEPSPLPSLPPVTPDAGNGTGGACQAKVNISFSD